MKEKNNRKDNSIDKKSKRLTKVNNITSIDSISEKNEESSNSTVKNTKLQSKNVLKKRMISSEITSVGNNFAITLKKPKRQTLEAGYNNKKLKPFRRKESKKKFDMNVLKRISFQQNNPFNFYNNIKTKEIFRKRESIKKTDDISHGDYRKSFERSSRNNINLSRTESFIDNKYFSSKKLKYTTLSPNKTNFKGQKNIQSSNIFEKLKNSVMFEKSEKIMFNIKICYAFLSIFSLASIVLEITDVILYHKKSDEYLKEKYNLESSNTTDIQKYYLIEERTISSQENSIRIFNLIFSLFCVFFLLLIQYIKIGFNQQSKKKKRYNYYMNYNTFFHKKKRNPVRTNNREVNNNDNHIKLILNQESNGNYEKKGEIISLIINCIISIIFFPPKVNKVFIGMQHNIIYVYSLNSIFLVVSIFKIINIYKAVFYLFPFNNLLYKTICSSNMVKMDFKFMFKFILNMYPLAFIIINFITIGLLVSVLIYCVEYFSIDINTKLINNKGINDLKDFYSEINLYCFFVLKNIHGNIKTNTILGSLIILIGGTVGLLISSYFIYYINLLIEFQPEEQQAFGKLVKLLNPSNNEHKAANLIKVFLLMKKIYIDNKNIRDEYLLKKENNFKNNYNKNTNNFNFGMNESIDSLTNMSQSNEYKDKKKFLKFLCSEFILKVKLINECKNFKNNLLIARNNSLSFNDVLKTLGEKMNANLIQLNNKIEVLIQNDQKFIGFMKFQENSLKNVRNLIRIQDNIINYLIERNNEAELIYFRENRDKQEKFLAALKNIGNNSGIPKMKSFAYGPFGFNRKFNIEKSLANSEVKNDKVKFNNKSTNVNKKHSLKKMRSSIVINNPNLHISVKKTKKLWVSKSNVLEDKHPLQKTKSLDDKILNVSKARKKEHKIKKDEIDKIITRKYSDNIAKKKLVIIKEKYEE